MTYEELQLLHQDVFLKEMDLYEVHGLKGLYVDGCIAIEKNMTLREKGCIYAEEIGHHLTSSGDILDQNIESNRKQEYRARMIAYDLQIGPHGIIESYEAGCRSLYQMADYLGITEDFLSDALECYRKKYGLCTRIDNYIIYFEPRLGVVKLI